MTLEELIKVMVDRRASDLHIRAKGPAYIRVDGDMTAIEGSEFTQSQVQEMGFSKMPANAKKDFEDTNQCDFSFGLEALGRFRVNFYKTQGFVQLAIRWISARIPSLEDLKLPVDPLKKMAANERGIVLVTGITGSGKSSTLAAMINTINEDREVHIITVEDPIEYVHQNKKAVISQREIGLDVPDFVQALRGAMRQDPDVILMGELRDLETVASAMTAAQTGHLVFGTLHTTDAHQTINRIIDLFPPYQQPQVRAQLAETLKGVISQRLLPAVRGGRVPAIEILVVTAHVKKLIEENKIGEIQAAIAKGNFYGMQTFNQSLVKLAKEGLAKQEDVLAAASNPDDVLLALRGIESGSRS